ncbi:MAG: hypothetical protein HOW73_36990 [Polyangiaceae bacterium]|nr:hypothetical protein [Polyangiaceae bacterium]
MLHRLAGTFVVAALALASFGCASNPVPAASSVVEDRPVKIDRGASSVEGELGGMNEDAVAKTFERLQAPILACVADGASRVREIGGHFSVSLRIDREGRARWAYLNETTLGDRATERCVLDVVRDATWPKPLGGDGLAQRSFDVDAGVEPQNWTPEKIRSAMKHLNEKAAHCKKGKGGRYVATAYVGKNGKVATAGVAPPSAEQQDIADCVADALEGMHLRSPGRRAAKVTIEL